MRRYEAGLRAMMESEVTVAGGECSHCGAPLLLVGGKVRCAREVYRSATLFHALWRGDAGWVRRWPYGKWLARMLCANGIHPNEEV